MRLLSRLGKRTARSKADMLQMIGGLARRATLPATNQKDKRGRAALIFAQPLQWMHEVHVSPPKILDAG